MASRSVNKVILLGHLGKDAETKFTPNGIAKTTFSLATNRRWKDQQSGEWKEITDWHNIVLWRSENLTNYLQKGKQVYIEGRIENRSWEDKEGQKRYITEIVCDELILTSGGRGDSGGGSGGGDFSGGPGRGDYSQQPVSMPRSARPAPPSAPAEAPPDEFNQGITDDDVPF
jgi:single-strand DNA-binding protein